MRIIIPYRNTTPSTAWVEIRRSDMVNDAAATRDPRSYMASRHGYETMRRGTRSVSDLPRWLLVGTLWLIAAAGLVQASEIYKSIDANGRVVYSDHLDASMSQATAAHC